MGSVFFFFTLLGPLSLYFPHTLSPPTRSAFDSRAIGCESTVLIANEFLNISLEEVVVLPRPQALASELPAQAKHECASEVTTRRREPLATIHLDRFPSVVSCCWFVIFFISVSRRALWFCSVSYSPIPLSQRTT